MSPSTPQPPEVLLLRPLLPSFDAALSGKFRFVKTWESPLPLHDYLAQRAASIRVLLCSSLQPVPPDVIDRLPALKLIVGSSVGLDHIDLAACRRLGIAVTNAGSVFTDDTADYAVGLLIDVLRHISASDRYVRQGFWPLMGDYPFSSKLSGKRVGIVGLGSIGSAIAKRLEAFGCPILYHSRTMKQSVSYKYFANVCDLASESDILIISCALTDETFHIIDKKVMLALGKHGVIINVGRGPLIDEKELVKCLMQGEIGGAGLDVFENEPVVPEELFKMDNVVLSGHSAVLTPESFHDLLELITANLEAFFSNKPLASPVAL
ncbi:hypothetical protein Cni_G14314 [Canna indica]|uniref:Hydroxyphenylpyruvate reductase n=1 Tax=Canna indica TaxID=4628 RepID=A0AAQ3KDW5_9LILI|nr:hypothetical protein Cni_G14314 [Canna indica]